MKVPKKLGAGLVSDHAVVRYLERIVGIDVESIRQRITAGRERAIADCERGEIKCHTNNMKLYVRNGIVITITALK